MIFQTTDYKTRIIETPENFTFNVFKRTDENNSIANFSNPQDFLNFMDSNFQLIEAEQQAEILSLIK